MIVGLFIVFALWYIIPSRNICYTSRDDATKRGNIESTNKRGEGLNL